MDRKSGDQDWIPSISSQPSSSPLRLPVTPPSASLLGASAQNSPTSYNRYPSQHTPHGLSPLHQRQLPPIPIQPYSTPPGRQTTQLPPIHSNPHNIAHQQYHIPPHNAPPTPGETAWDLRQIDVYRLDEGTCRNRLVDAIHHIQYLNSTLSATRTTIAQCSLQNTLLRNESREISQRSAVETELAKREVEVLLREYAAQMPSANQLANTYYRRYRGLKRRVKDLEAVIESKDTEIKRLQEYVRDSGISVPREGAKRTRRTGLKYAPRGGAWAGKPKSSPVVPRTLKPAPTLQASATATKSENNGNSQESQSSGLDALGMLASQVLDSQDSQPSQTYYPPSTPVSSRRDIPTTPKLAFPPSSQPPALLSPLPLPSPTKRRRTNSRASESTISHDAATESEKSPTKLRMMDSDDEDAVKESPPPRGHNVYASALPIPYRTGRNGRDFPLNVPRRKLNFDSNDSELLNHDDM